MIACRKCQGLIVEALYEELSETDRAWFNSHLQKCGKCAHTFAQMQSTLKVMDSREREEPAESYWEGYWSRLENELQPQTKFRVPLMQRLAEQLRPLMVFERKWLYQLSGAVAILLLGILLGRSWFAPRTSGTGNPSVPAKRVMPALLQQQTQNYLERSKVLLLGIVNFDAENEDPFVLNFPEKQRISRELVDQSAHLKNQLDAANQRRLLELISDLEVILLQIANFEAEAELPAIDLIRSAVDQHSILFKIDLSNLRHEKPFPKKTDESKNTQSQL